MEVGWGTLLDDPALHPDLHGAEELLSGLLARTCSRAGRSERRAVSSRALTCLDLQCPAGERA